MNARTALGVVRLAALLSVAMAAMLVRPPGDVALATSTLDRDADPVVLTGAVVPALNGVAPGSIVAFAYDGGWVQIPVQVDERIVVSQTTVYDGAFTGIDVLSYADASTFAGADPDPMLDSNDEIVFMAKDAGDDPASFAEPAGVVATSGHRVLVEDPLAPGDSGVVYLFEQDGSLDPSAGQQYVNYDFNLLSGDYLTTYNIPDGPNPEDSSVTSPYYSHHFSDRWVSDEVRIFAGGASGADILDRHKAMFGPGQCVRSEDTFSDAEGAFIVNKSGPVRALRDYIGANSGIRTQRSHFFYEQRQDISTDLRVHAIPGVMDFFDYSPDASGMTYSNSLNPGGFTIDGVPDATVAGAHTWEMVSGPQGSLIMAANASTNIAGFNYTSYYLDDSTPPVTQCTGDAFAYGSSGRWVNTQVPCTDWLFASSNCASYLNTTRYMYYEAPGATSEMAEERQLQALAPLTVDVSRWFDAAGNADGDALANGVDNCTGDANAGQENNDRNFIEMAPLLYDDVTHPMSDGLGDACDADSDNDGLSNALETPAPPCPSASSATNPLVADSDGDLFTDGAECALGSDPANVASVPASIVGADTDGDGVPDAYDSDDANGDTDGDGLIDRFEFRYYGTSMTSTNGDGDTCTDAREIASINGDSSVSSIDLSQLAQHFGQYALPAPAHLANFDMNKDGRVSSIDLSFVAQRFGMCTP